MELLSRWIRWSGNTYLIRWCLTRDVKNWGSWICGYFGEWQGGLLKRTFSRGNSNLKSLAWHSKQWEKTSCLKRQLETLTEQSTNIQRREKLFFTGVKSLLIKAQDKTYSFSLCIFSSPFYPRTLELLSLLISWSQITWIG